MLMTVPENYNPMLAYFGENADAVIAMLKPLSKQPPDSVTIRIAVVPGGVSLKPDLWNMIGMIGGGPEGMQLLLTWKKAP